MPGARPRRGQAADRRERRQDRRSPVDADGRGRARRAHPARRGRPGDGQGGGLRGQGGSRPSSRRRSTAATRATSRPSSVGWSGRVDPDGNLYNQQASDGPTQLRGRLGRDGRRRAQRRPGGARPGDAARALPPSWWRSSTSARRILYLYHDCASYLGTRPGDQRRRDARRRPPAAGFASVDGAERAMRGYLLRRAGASLIVLLIASVVIFVGVRALPGDPALALAGEDRSQQALAEIAREVRARRPGARAVRPLPRQRRPGRPRHSARTGLDVRDTIVDRLPITIELALLEPDRSRSSLGIGAGVVSAVRRGSAGRLRRQPRGADRALAAQLLARPGADPGLRRSASAVLPASGFVAVLRGPGRQPAQHDPAGDRARQRARGADHAPDARGDARLAERRLRAHRSRQGPLRARRSSAATRCATA